MVQPASEPALLPPTMRAGKPARGLPRHVAGLFAVTGVVATVAVLLVPLPTQLLDLCLAANLAASLLLLLTSIRGGGVGPALPSVIVVLTLARLALNVGSTRLILLQADAGQVIDAFGRAVIGGNAVVGAVLFGLLFVVQLVVITKGAERIAEVSARFDLDALPGRQLAIEADLRAGAITAPEAARRRDDLAHQSRFFGAMDGAMKFVKGDVVASVIIVCVNLVGGFAVGVGQQGWGAREALDVYGRLTIGDGLASQLPAIFIATAASLAATTPQLRPVRSLREPLLMTGMATCLIAVLPTMPALPFLGVGGGLIALSFAWRMVPRSGAAAPWGLSLSQTAASRIAAGRGLLHRMWSGTSVAAVSLRNLSARTESEVGFELPSGHCWVDPALPDGRIELRVHELVVASVELPAGLARREQLALIRRELGPALSRQAFRLFGVEAAAALLADAVVDHARVVSELESRLPFATLHSALQELVRDQLSLAGKLAILEALVAAERSVPKNDLAALTSATREHLRGPITRRVAPSGTLRPVLLDSLLEETIRDALPERPELPLTLAPGARRDVVRSLIRAIERLDRKPRVILTTSDIRPHVQKVLEQDAPDVWVVAPGELDPRLAVEPAGTASLVDGSASSEPSPPAPGYHDQALAVASGDRVVQGG